MQLQADTCYQALRARDRRFDGLFFVGVSTTGIYCRPICPARAAGRDRCTFFHTAAEAERAGYRACFRCRPELAPGNSTIDSVSRHVRSAAARIDAGYLNTRSVDDLACTLGISARHLRRAMESELGVSPVELAQTRRLALAKQLLHDSSLPLIDVAFASGYSSLRRFNAAFRERFGKPPSVVRRKEIPGTEETGDGAITLRLDYRPPLAWGALLRFLAGRALPGIETVDDQTYRRTVVLDSRVRGHVVVRAHESKPALWATVSLSLAAKLPELVARLRRLFDLDARPDAVASHLGTDARLRASLDRFPGLRVPGAFDPFEVGLRTILGQQVTVRAASTLTGRLITRFGAPGAAPAPQTVAQASVRDVQSIGIPATRAATLIRFAEALSNGSLDLTPGSDPIEVSRRLQEIPGIGPWTAEYLSMRVLGWPDALPAGDLVLKKALAISAPRAVEERAKRWQPWRSYAVMHLWSSSNLNGG